MKDFRKLLVFILLFSLITLAEAQTQLNSMNTTWTQVLGGKFLSKPVTTPYGFIGATDGRSIASISNNGVILWEENLSVNSRSIINTVSEDFTLAVTNDNKKITLLNPSGVPLWSKVLDNEIIDKAYEGRDGRFFLRGKNVLFCYGINGICKWQIKTEDQSNIGIQELNDGSLIIFLKELNDGKTRALRITPFGKALEDITFAGEIISACTSKDGIFLTFSDGSAGLFSLDLKENKAINKFVLNKDQYQSSTLNFFISKKTLQNGMFVTLQGKGIKILYIESQSGKILWEKTLGEIDIKDIKESVLTNQGFFICDCKTAYYLGNSGTINWHALLPENKNRNKWKNLVFTENNTLVVFKDNWSMDAYIVSQSIGKQIKDTDFDYYKNYLSVDSSVYSNIFQYDFDPEITSFDRYKMLEAGYYGDKEISFTSDILSACQAYMKNSSESNFGTREDLTVFQTNTTQLQSLLNQLPLYGTRYTSNLTAKLLLKEKNNSILNSLLSGITKCGYDPDGEILKALENLASKTTTKNITTQMNICDAVYAVCRFMGRPAYNKSGKIILKNFMSISRDSKVRIKARETMENIAKLEK